MMRRKEIHCHQYKNIIGFNIFACVREKGFNTFSNLDNIHVYCTKCFKTREELQRCHICNKKNKAGVGPIIGANTLIYKCYICKSFCCQKCIKDLKPVYLSKSKIIIINSYTKFINRACKIDKDKIELLLLLDNNNKERVLIYE